MVHLIFNSSIEATEQGEVEIFRYSLSYVFSSNDENLTNKNDDVN